MGIGGGVQATACMVKIAARHDKRGQHRPDTSAERAMRRENEAVWCVHTCVHGCVRHGAICVTMGHVKCMIEARLGYTNWYTNEVEGQPEELDIAPRYATSSKAVRSATSNWIGACSSSTGRTGIGGEVQAAECMPKIAARHDKESRDCPDRSAKRAMRRENTSVWCVHACANCSARHGALCVRIGQVHCMIDERAWYTIWYTNEVEGQPGERIIANPMSGAHNWYTHAEEGQDLKGRSKKRVVNQQGDRRRQYAGVILGEAKNPGPVVSMPGHGNCMFHAIGYWAGQGQEEVRKTIAQQSSEYWNRLFPWDEGPE